MCKRPPPVNTAPTAAPILAPINSISEKFFLTLLLNVTLPLFSVIHQQQ